MTGVPSDLSNIENSVKQLEAQPKNGVAYKKRESLANDCYIISTAIHVLANYFATIATWNTFATVKNYFSTVLHTESTYMNEGLSSLILTTFLSKPVVICLKG